MKKVQKIILVVFIVICTAFTANARIENSLKMIPSGFSDLAKHAKPGVVNIQTVKTIKGGGRVYRHFFGQPFGEKSPFNEFFSPFNNQRPQDRKERSLGSGFIVTKDGYIVTNNHVIADADEIKVIMYNDKEFDAKIIGTDPMTDLALIKIEANNLQPLKLGSSNDLEVGNWVVAIGNPFGLEQTVTAGIVSAKGRIIGAGAYDDFIQTDASINPGNSGGPLLNLQGEVVGINTAIVRSGQGIGFAIPSDLAQGIIDQLIESKQVSRGWLGVAIQNVTPDLAEYYGFKQEKGVLIAKVYKGDPADLAGIRSGDIIIKINDKEINDIRDLSSTIAGYQVGTKVLVNYVRDSKVKKVKIKLGKRPVESQEPIISTEGYDIFGLKLKQMDKEIANKLGLVHAIDGLVVIDIDPKGKAYNSGIKAGDVIIEVNRHEINSLEDYTQYLKKIKKGKIIQLLIRRGNTRVYAINFTK